MQEAKEIRAPLYVEGELPPKGHMLVRVATPESTEGVLCWMRPEDIHPDGGKRSTLTPEQRERARAMYRKIGRGVMDWNKTTEDWFNGFEQDSNPERELQVWEVITEVYVKERARRVNVPKEELRLLLHTLVFATNSGGRDPEEVTRRVIRLHPPCRQLPHLRRAIESFVEKPLPPPTPDKPPLLIDGEHRVIPVDRIDPS